MTEQVTIVTGGGGDIGRGVCEAFTTAGATVVAVDLDPSAAKAATRRVTCDLTDPAECRSAVDDVVSEYGGVDTVINLAQVMILDVPFKELTDEHMRVSFETGPIAALRMMLLCYPHFLARGGGAVINFASGAGTQGRPLAGAYAAAKEAIRGLTKTAAIEWGPDNIRVNVVCPLGSSHPTEGAIGQLIPGVPLGRVGDPVKDIGPLLLYLASPNCYMTGRTLHIDGGVAGWK